ncbi:AAC(3) family N-acetyltransferase [Streptomyces sp. B93]|uniref:AAC(3) family N-acetyltransferase n=1 Tax=Streptomyces sp. B93 TaxID=2824875 RepID=UPI0027E4542B|nr:AAC(3) family N-acetyltransferase [Streptomyces sp. B93]
MTPARETTPAALPRTALPGPGRRQSATSPPARTHLPECIPAPRDCTIALVWVPSTAFAAVGPQAAELIAAQTPTDVYGPVRTLADNDGALLLVGVGLNRMTALHLAEQQSGRQLPVRWARAADGRVIMVETGSCSEGFPRLEPWLRPLARTTQVGESQWSAYPAKKTLAAAVEAMTADQNVTHCANPHCLACRDSVSGGPIGRVPLG